MENKSVNPTQPEQLEQWVNNAVISLSASLLFGREKASQIAQPLLTALFTLTANEYKTALDIITKIDNFSVKRIFLEQFKYCYILNTGSKNLSVLISKVDFSDQQMSDKYDTALLKLLNENDKDFALVEESLGALPINAKRMALKRLYSEEFAKFRKVKVKSRLGKDGRYPPLIQNWQWVLIFIILCTVAIFRSV